MSCIYKTSFTELNSTVSFGGGGGKGGRGGRGGNKSAHKNKKQKNSHKTRGYGTSGIGGFGGGFHSGRIGYSDELDQKIRDTFADMGRGALGGVIAGSRGGLGGMVVGGVGGAIAGASGIFH